MLHAHHLQSSVLQIARLLGHARVLRPPICRSDSNGEIDAPLSFHFEGIQTFNFEALHDMVLHGS